MVPKAENRRRIVILSPSGSKRAVAERVRDCRSGLPAPDRVGRGVPGRVGRAGASPHLLLVLLLLLALLVFASSSSSSSSSSSLPRPPLRLPLVLWPSRPPPVHPPPTFLLHIVAVSPPWPGLSSSLATPSSRIFSSLSSLETMFITPLYQQHASHTLASRAHGPQPQTRATFLS